MSPTNKNCFRIKRKLAFAVQSLSHFPAVICMDYQVWWSPVQKQIFSFSFQPRKKKNGDNLSKTFIQKKFNIKVKAKIEHFTFSSRFSSGKVDWHDKCWMQSLLRIGEGSPTPIFQPEREKFKHFQLGSRGD